MHNKLENKPENLKFSKNLHTTVFKIKFGSKKIYVKWKLLFPIWKNDPFAINILYKLINFAMCH